MQEEIENRTVNLAISTTKLTARGIIRLAAKGLAYIKRKSREAALNLLHCSRSRISCCQTRQLWRDFRQRSQQCHRTTRCKIHEQSG